MKKTRYADKSIIGIKSSQNAPYTSVMRSLAEKNKGLRYEPNITRYESCFTDVNGNDLIFTLAVCVLLYDLFLRFIIVFSLL